MTKLAIAIAALALIATLGIVVTEAYAQSCPPGTHISGCWTENTSAGAVQHCNCVGN